jgi:hypothetical protein
MAIFKRQEQREQQAAAAAAQTVQVGEPLQQARIVPPFVASGTASQAATAPGVVPPPAAEMYSMRVPEQQAATVDTASGSLIVEKARTQQSSQENVQERVRVAVQKARTAAPAPAPRRRQLQKPAPAPRRPSFDASRCAQTGLLNLAWSWQQAGAPIRAINAYMQLLTRYPGTDAADAAVADLVELSDRLAQQGQFHIALAIYEQLEQLT